jgi:hypothetical protein
MIKERIITVEKMQFKAQLHTYFLLLVIEIDNITIMVKHSFKTGITLLDRYEIFKSTKPEEIAVNEYKWLKQLVASNPQLKETL